MRLVDATEAITEAEEITGAPAPAAAPPAAAASWQSDPAVVGTLLCILSAVGYTATNVCLRDVSTHVDAFWVSCIKAAPTVVVAALLMAARASRGLPVAISRRACLSLVAIGIVAQIGGNAAFQWTLQAIGLALAVPISFGTMMISGAITGRIWLGERVTSRAMLAMTVLIAAIATLSAGAADASRSIDLAQSARPSVVAGGVALACFAGVAYALLSVVIRRVSRPAFPLSTMLLVICGTGLVTLGAATVLRIGLSGIAATSPRDAAVMLLAGIFNAGAFFSLSKALRLVSVVHVNLVNASQVAMAALVGVLWFGEARTPALGIGVAMTVAGLLVMRRR